MLLDSFRVCSRSQPRQALPPVLSTPPVLPPLFTTPDNEQPSSASAGPSDATALVLPFMRTVSPQKLIIGDFLPLPTIEASPICPSTAPFPTSTPAVEAFSSQDCTQSHSRMSLRVVFPPPTSTSTPPTPPRNTQKALIRDPQKPSHPVPPSASFPVSTTLPTPLAGPTNQLKRCLSCPAIVSRSQVFPLVSQSSHPQSPGVSGVHGRKRSKTVFHLPTDNGDSPVDERTISSLGPGLSRSTTGHVPAPSTSQNSSKDAIRIFYAVQELLMTEIDYVRDLRILFTVGTFSPLPLERVLTCYTKGIHPAVAFIRDTNTDLCQNFSFFYECAVGQSGRPDWPVCRTIRWGGVVALIDFSETCIFLRRNRIVGS